MKRRINAKIIRVCAFCKYWYDPANSLIQPVPLVKNIWEFDSASKSRCMLRNVTMPGGSNCPKYECKLYII